MARTHIKGRDLGKWSIKRYNLRSDNEVPGLFYDVYIKDFLFTGLSDFKVHKLKFDCLNLKVSFDVSVPKLLLSMQNGLLDSNIYGYRLSGNAKGKFTNMKIFYYVLTIACLAKAVPVDIAGTSEVKNGGTPRFMEGVIEDLLESVRDTILNGSEDVPVLDPFVVDHLHVDDETLPFPGAHLTISDGTVKHLGSFIIDHLRTSTWLLVTTIEVRGHIPVIEVDAGAYDLFLPVMGYTVYGAGDLHIKVLNPRVDITIRYGIVTGMSTVATFSIDDVEPQINGIFNDQAASDFVNLFLKFLVLDLLEIYEDEINNLLSDTINDIVGDVLPDFLPFRGYINRLGFNVKNK